MKPVPRSVNLHWQDFSNILLAMFAQADAVSATPPCVNGIAG